jgi:glycogen synthase
MSRSPLEIALVSEHASPLTPAGGIDAGGQNIYVRALAEHLAAFGHDVSVYTRRTAEHVPERVRFGPGAWAVHVPMGPAASVPKEDLLPFVGELAGHLRQRWRDRPPDIVHAHYWMSGAASLASTRRTPIPVIETFHARQEDKFSFGTLDERERERE